MAWDASRRGTCPLAQTLGRRFSYVDEVDILDSLIRSNTPDSSTADMYALLSPVQEEHRVLDAPLAVTVTVRFNDPPVRSVYRRSYCSSQSFAPADRTCRGLLRRIRHCSEELITRKDSDALNPAQCLHKGPKPLRFELTFDIRREGFADTWAELTFRSYQKQALTSASAKDVMRSTHNIVGMFLRRHDPDFRWTDEPAHEYFPDRPETFRPSHTGPLESLKCIPRARFLEATQTWEFVPGYSLELTLKSSNPARCRPDVTRTLKVDSRQTSPLNLGASEDLLWQAYSCVQDVLDQKKSAFDLEHADCDGFDGVPDCDCQHFDEDALRVELRVVNNLGPLYEHLHRSVQSRLRLFVHPDGRDCDDFVSIISARFQQFRDGTDNKIESLPDFDFRIAELIGHGWHEKNCARFTIGGRQSHSRRSIRALLDRIRCGVGDVLRGHDVAIRMIAYKRGHLILDKALIARDHQQAPVQNNLTSAQDQHQIFLARLKARIQRDMDMICSDTCSLDDIPDGPPTPERPLRHSRSSYAPGRPYTPRSTAPPLSYHTPPGSPANFTTHPATPPQIPTRKSSRVFPLVPAKFKESGETVSSTAPAVQDHVTGAHLDGGHRAVGDAARSESVVDVLPPPGPHESTCENASDSGHDMQGLGPAAEVYPTFKTPDYDTDSNSTHSSMPALTESDTPSPDHSMLVTPGLGRPSSPATHSPPFMGGSEAHRLSAPWMMDTSAPSSSIHPEVERFTGPKSPLARTGKLPSGRPVTPIRAKTVDSAPVDTPEAPVTPSGDEKTPLAHRSMQGPTGLDIVQNLATPREVNPHDTTVQTSHLPDITVREAEDGNETVDRAQQDLPAEGWLLHRVEHEPDVGSQSRESLGVDDAAVAVAQCGSSETLRPSKVVKQRSIDHVAGLQDDQVMNESSSTPCPPTPSSSARVKDAVGAFNPSVPTEKPESNASADPDPAPVASDATTDQRPSPLKLDLSNHGEDSAIDLETMEDSDPTGDTVVPEMQVRRLLGLSEGPEDRCQLTLSGSGIDIRTGSGPSQTRTPELLENLILSPIDEKVFDFGFGALETVLGSSDSPTEPEREFVSGPPDRADARESSPTVTSDSDSLSAATEGTEGLDDGPEAVEKTSLPAPRAASEPDSPSEGMLSAPISRTSRSVSNPHSYSSRLGLGNSRLLPPLPVLANFTPTKTTGNVGASRSSSSSWEDCISTGRQSSDSVDTFKPSPTSSNEDEDEHAHGLDSPKRLGTPTAGLLGLHESCWADFGIRTALTGTHAFDRPSTAPSTPGSPEEGRVEARQLIETVYGGGAGHEKAPLASSQRRTILLKPKKSIGSMVHSAKAHRLNKKESRELGKKPSQDLNKRQGRTKAVETRPGGGGVAAEAQEAAENDHASASRFSGAMILVAGLAFASSVVSRNHS